MPTYILPTHQSDENASSYIDFAVLEINEEMKQRLAHFKKVGDEACAKLGEGAHPELVWFNYWATYYGFYGDPISDNYEEGSFAERLDQALADSTIIEATDEELDSLGLSYQRTEIDEIHICRKGVYWTCCPRNMGIEVRTDILTWEQLGIE